LVQLLLRLGSQFSVGGSSAPLWFTRNVEGESPRRSSFPR
jgi:hypothetical protein